MSIALTAVPSAARSMSESNSTLSLVLEPETVPSSILLCVWERTTQGGIGEQRKPGMYRSGIIATETCRSP